MPDRSKGDAMEDVFSKEVQAGLRAAHLAGLRNSSRLRLVVDGIVYPVLRQWKTGFSVEAKHAPHLRGLVDLYDGATHLFQCLIVATEPVDDEMHYEFKRATAVATTAPVDFERPVNAPAALLTADY